MNYWERELRRIAKEEKISQKLTDRVLRITPTMIFKTTMVTKRKERKQYEQQTKRKQ